MISIKHRFHGHNSLRFVYQNGRTVRGSLVSIRYVLNNRRSDFRVAVVVSKKVSKSAVVRNRIRRRLYEYVRLHQAEIKAPYDIVITVFKEELATMPSEKLYQTMEDLVSQARVNARSGAKDDKIEKMKRSS